MMIIKQNVYFWAVSDCFMTSEQLLLQGGDCSDLIVQWPKYLLVIVVNDVMPQANPLMQKNIQCL